jgi:curved DNA-binding protein CbpA
MNDPYDVMELPRGSSEADIRRRYLELVRQFPPERAPERFTEIRAAYEQLRDPAARLEARLFEPTAANTLGAVLSDLRQKLRTSRIPTHVLLSLAER